MPIALHQSPSHKSDSVRWGRELAQTKHSICRTIARGVQSGLKVRPQARRAARRWNGKPYRCDPTRKFSLSQTTIVRAWYRWQRGGQVPAAVRLQFNGSAHAMPALMLVRFVTFCAEADWTSQRAAWRAFIRQPGAFARGPRPAKHNRRYSFGTVRRHFPFAAFRALQAARKAEAAARHERAVLLVQTSAEIRRRLPDRPKRKRRTGAEFSLQGAQL